jgi:DNA-binding transcriptional MerR regulator
MKKFLKVGEVADLCGCCERTIRKFTDNGGIKSFRNYTNYRMIPIWEALKLQEILVGRKTNLEIRKQIALEYLKERKNIRKRPINWIKRHQGKHFCKCGCKNKIKIAKWMYTQGIPKYYKNHYNRQIKEEKKRIKSLGAAGRILN